MRHTPQKEFYSRQKGAAVFLAVFLLAIAGIGVALSNGIQTIAFDKQAQFASAHNVSTVEKKTEESKKTTKDGLISESIEKECQLGTTNLVEAKAKSAEVVVSEFLGDDKSECGVQWCDNLGNCFLLGQSKALAAKDACGENTDKACFKGELKKLGMNDEVADGLAGKIESTLQSANFSKEDIFRQTPSEVQEENKMLLESLNEEREDLNQQLNKLAGSSNNQEKQEELEGKLTEIESLRGKLRAQQAALEKLKNNLSTTEPKTRGIVAPSSDDGNDGFVIRSESTFPSGHDDTDYVDSGTNRKGIEIRVDLEQDEARSKYEEAQSRLEEECLVIFGCKDTSRAGSPRELLEARKEAIPKLPSDFLKKEKERLDKEINDMNFFERNLTHSVKYRSMVEARDDIEDELKERSSDTATVKTVGETPEPKKPAATAPPDSSTKEVDKTKSVDSSATDSTSEARRKAALSAEKNPLGGLGGILGQLFGGQNNAQCQQLAQQCAATRNSSICSAAQQCANQNSGLGGLLSKLGNLARGGGGSSNPAQTPAQQASENRQREQNNFCEQRYPGTRAVNGRCACPNNQAWTGSKCETREEAAAPESSTATLKAELSCSPKAQDHGAPIAISFACRGPKGTTLRADGFEVEGAALSGSAVAKADLEKIDPLTKIQKFALSCIKDGETQTKSCEVQVNKAALVVVANPSSVNAGEQGKVGWLSAGSKRCGVRATGDSDEVVAFNNAHQNATQINGTATTPPLTEDMEIVVRCETHGGAVLEEHAFINVRS